MEKFISHLKHNKIRYELIGGYSVKIDGKTYQFVEPKNGKHFNSDFKFLADDTDRDRYAYSFGGKFYWLDRDDRERVKLRPLRYIGSANQELETDTFLGVHGEYELLNGGGNYTNWIKKAKFFGIKSLGICEKNTLAGTAKFQKACEEEGIKPIFGATYTVYRESEDYHYDITFYVRDLIGWVSILEINKAVNVDGKLTETFMLKTVENLIVVLDPKDMEYEKIFPVNLSLGDNLYFKMDTVEYKNEGVDERYLRNLQKFFKDKTLKPLPISDAYYIEKDESDIKFKLNVIGKEYDYICRNQYFKNKDDYLLELFNLFGGDDEKAFEVYEEMLENESTVVNLCTFRLKFGLKHLPPYIMTPEQKKRFKSTEDLFWHLIEEGFKKREISEEDADRYIDRIETEFKTIDKGGFVDYFLNTWDIINYAKTNGMTVNGGRGSAAGCLIAYLLQITDVDSLDRELLFERFLNDGRLGASEEAEYSILYGENGEVKKVYHDDELIIIRDEEKIVVKGKRLKTGDIIV